MLAPRQKLWSTPQEVMLKAIDVLNLHENDVCFDVGCGDGRFIFELCSHSNCSIIGIEIVEDRCHEIESRLVELNLSNRCQIVNRNALEVDYSTATAFYLYLVPRGLKLFYQNVILKLIENGDKELKVVTYMSPLPVNLLKPTAIYKVTTNSHAGAQWPLFYYHINPK
jgi:precorrin-6B methylase 2